MAKILIVDDNEQNSQLLEDIVTRWSHEVFMAHQGMGVYELAERILPDVILLDVMLPGRSGYEVCRELKESVRTRYIPVVMISALTDVEDRIHAYHVGADNFLIKPIHYNELRAILEHLLFRKCWLDCMEERESIVRVLTVIAQAVTPEATIGPCLKKEWFAGKLARYLGLNEESEQRVLIAISLQNIGSIKKGGAPLEWALLLLSEFKMSKWLNTLIEYVYACREGAEEKLKDRLGAENLYLEAAIVRVMDMFCTLLQEEQCNELEGIRRLQEQMLGQKDEQSVLKGLEQVIKDDWMLNTLRTNG